MNIRLCQIDRDSLACEPFLRRMPNGELLCLCQLGGSTEPAMENRVYFYHSSDNGETWSPRTLLAPEDGRAVYCTGLHVEGEVITAYLTFHTGRFLDWECQMAQSRDNGYTWQEILLTDFPGGYSYSDGFYEAGHLYLTVEHNRATILFFDITL